MAQNFDGIVERNQRALRDMRPRRSYFSFVADVFRDAFDPAVPAHERRTKQIALAIVALVIAGAVATFLLWPRGGAAGGTVRSHTGASVDLGALYEHERVVAVFYPGSGFDPEPFLEELERMRPQFDAKLVAITSHPVDRAAALHDKLHLGFEIYVDPTFKVIPEWKVPFATKDATSFAVFIIEPGGKISFQKIGQPFPTWDEIAAKTRSTK